MPNIFADPDKMNGATIYIAGVNCADNSNASGEPCKLCRRMILNARIAKVVYLDRDGKIVVKTPSEIQN